MRQWARVKYIMKDVYLAGFVLYECSPCMGPVRVGHVGAAADAGLKLCQRANKSLRYFVLL
jgi:hypothetical protein